MQGSDSAFVPDPPSPSSSQFCCETVAYHMPMLCLSALLRKCVPQFTTGSVRLVMERRTIGMEGKRSGVAGGRVTSAFIADSGQRRNERAEQRGLLGHMPSSLCETKRPLNSQPQPRTPRVALYWIACANTPCRIINVSLHRRCGSRDRACLASFPLSGCIGIWKHGSSSETPTFASKLLPYGFVSTSQQQMKSF
jgi:hypothetical protein